MGKKDKKRNRKQPKGVPRGSAPLVHVKVASLESDLGAAAALVKPAILYADKVTINSPVASMVEAVTGLTKPRTREDQLTLFLQIIDAVPEFAERVQVGPDVLEGLRAVMRLNPKTLKTILTRSGTPEKFGEFQDMMSGWDELFQRELPQAVDAAKAQVNAGELFDAVAAGAVVVAPLGDASPAEVTSDSINEARGTSGGEAAGTALTDFVARLVEMLTEHRSFPLLDAGSSGLVRSLETSKGYTWSDRSLQHGAEVTSAATFMGYLPYFPDLPMNEVLDLRNELRTPLVRFRSAMATMSTRFSSRIHDKAFDVEVADYWRSDVEPALAEIRESLAEHGFLREAASIALGDPRRLLIEAGGVFAATQGELLSLSGFLAAAAAAGLPAIDVLGRTVKAALENKSQTRKNSMYFLHQLAERT